MPTKARFLTVGNWLLLACNIVLLVALIVPWLTSDDAAMRRAHEEAEPMAKNVYFAKGPFAILVDKTFPQQHSFTFGDYSQQLTAQGYSRDSHDDSKATRTAMLGVGTQIVVSCEYWIEEAHGGPEAHVESIMLSTDKMGVWD